MWLQDAMKTDNNMPGADADSRSASQHIRSIEKHGVMSDDRLEYLKVLNETKLSRNRQMEFNRRSTNP